MDVGKTEALYKLRVVTDQMLQGALYKMSPKLIQELQGEGKATAGITSRALINPIAILSLSSSPSVRRKLVEAGPE